MADTTLSADQFLYQSSLKGEPAVRVSSRKRCPYVIDLNQGSYANGVITIDATSQLNGAEGFACLRDSFIMLPFKVTLKNTHATQALQAPANRLSVSFKCGIWNVIDAMSLELSGKSILSTTEYKLFVNNLRAQVESSTAYVEKHGAEAFLFPDTSGSLTWSNAAGAYGDGFCNTAADVTAALGTAATGATVLTANEGFVRRLLANPTTSNANTNGWPAIASGASKTISNQFGRGAFVAGAATAGSIAGTWNYLLKIRLVDLHPIFKELDLMANPQIKLRFRVNQGVSVIATSATTKNMALTSTTLASGSVCPIMVASGTGTSSPNSTVIASAGAGEISVAWGAIVNNLEPTIDSTYFPFTTTRLYVPFVDLENPQAIVSKPTKKVRYLDYYAQWFYQRAGTGTSTTQLNTAFDLQLSASIKNAKYVVLLPFAETSTGNFATATMQQFQSPFDSAPWTVQPGSSIRNFNVRIGSQQVFDISYDYDFMDFCNEFAKLSAINGDITPELTNGLIDYYKWSTTNRVLVADVSRLTEKDVPQSIQVMGTNASCQGCNMLVIVAFENELVYDRLTGEVTEYTAN
ncbi:hypothetical protein PF005_g19834 [Phytophthora fragariae]|uniref:Uncharacterized protein n=3 Tax=Phytophthora fragariae TaxID=53985 RepID=A0A6A3WQ64_9STRA|nr:hypothetical protein PF009_g19902 [Phytophthora fragariae]KAE9188996.1 hypothetical protein PF005_g19834 [Phytophthora fragariae]